MFSFGVDVAQAATKVVSPPSNSVMDEEAQKRNTDCIYFLASPLTCKKGTTCEYRHSEAARMNPRDCRFWKAGNCLNPRCSFRHLPLDGKSVSAASVASTSSAPVMTQSAPATAPSNKSKTPCYFFSQGYCAKNDKCPFVHGVPAASRANAATRKNLAVGVNGNSVHNGGRPRIVLKQSASKVPIISQKAPQISSCLENSNFSERDGIFTPLRHNEEYRKPNVYGGRLPDVKQNQLKVEIEQGLNDTNDNVQAADWRHLTQVDALLDNRPLTGGGFDPSASCSDSHQISTSPSNSTSSKDQVSFEQLRSGDSEDMPLDNWESQSGCFRDQCQVFSKHVADASVCHHERADKVKKQRMGLKEQDSSADLRSHLMNRREQNKLHAVSEKPEVKGQTDMVIRGCESQRLSKDCLIQKNGKLLASADIDGTEAGGRGNSAPLERGPLRKVSKTDKCLTLESGSSVQTLSFAGPKTLAQIKAEKMAGRGSASEAARKHSLSSAIMEAGGKAAAIRKPAKPAEVAHVAASGHNLSSSPLTTGSIIKSIDDTQKTVTSLEFEGPRPLRVLLKRKRELESDSNVSETMSEPLEVEASMLTSCREVDGDDSEGSKEERLLHIPCLLGFGKEDLQAISPSSGEVVPRGGVEAAKFDVDLSEEVNSDAEMEDVAYGDADYSLDDDDDDEEDFAKKLGRFFALSSN